MRVRVSRAQARLCGRDARAPRGIKPTPTSPPAFSRERLMSALPDFWNIPALTLARTARWERIVQRPNPPAPSALTEMLRGDWGEASTHPAPIVQNTQR